MEINGATVTITLTESNAVKIQISRGASMLAFLAVEPWEIRELVAYLEESTNLLKDCFCK